MTVGEAHRLLRDVSEEFEPAESNKPGDRGSAPVTWVPAWFNPWAHQTSEQVWAGLAHAILNALGAVLHPATRDRERYWLARNAQRLDARAIRRSLWHRSASPAFKLAVWAVLAPVAVRLTDPTMQLYWFGGKVFSAATLAFLLPIGLLVAAIAHTAWRYFRAPAAAYLPDDLLRGPVLSGTLAEAAVDRPEPLRDPLHHARSGYLYLYQHDIKTLLETAGRRGFQLVVFIDDLDRCGPQTTAEVLGAVNLFLSEQFPHSRFVLGLDPVVVAAHIDHVYRDLPETKLIAHEDDPSPGWTFLRKLIQLPVTLPYITDAAITRLLATELGDIVRERSAAVAPSTVDAEKAISDLAPMTPPPPAVGLPASSPRTEKMVAETQNAQDVPAAAPPAALECSPQVRELLVERLLAQPSRSVRETKRLVTVWQFYVRLLGLIDPIPPAAAEERARHLVLLAEVITRWPALQRHLNRRIGSTHGLTLLTEAASDDRAWARALHELDLVHPTRAHACDNLRALLTAYEMKSVADLATRLM